MIEEVEYDLILSLRKGRGFLEEPVYETAPSQEATDSFPTNTAEILGMKV